MKVKGDPVGENGCGAGKRLYKPRGRIHRSPGGPTENKWGAYRMKPWVGMLRGLALVCVVLGGTALGSAAVSVLAARTAAAQTVSSIVVEGNRRVEADTIRSSRRTALAAFAVIVVAELGDLTQILTANLVARYHNP